MSKQVKSNREKTRAMRRLEIISTYLSYRKCSIALVVSECKSSRKTVLKTLKEAGIV